MNLFKRRIFSCLFKTLYVISFLLFSNCTASSTVYVSSSLGSDNYSGQSEDAPFKTIAKALTLSSDIKLKAGDIFYETVALKGKTLTRYGEGNNPMLCGYKRIKRPNWEKVEEHIWKIKLSDDNFTGYVTKGSTISNNIGCLHEYDKDLIHGRKVQYKNELAEDWDIWQTERHDRQVPPSEFDWLYLYYSGNPNSLKLEFSIYDTALRIENSTIDGVDVVGFGFGVAGGTKTIFRNCNIDAIGGRIQLGAKEYVCYGNGIEFYVNRNIYDCLVEDCKISRCYDCGVTIQASGCGQSTPKNIIIRNNLIENCCQGWEDFLRNDSNVNFINCVFENNTVLNSGDIGFGYPKRRFKYCHILGNNETGHRGMRFKNNTFGGGNFFCGNPHKGKYASNIMDGNTCVIKRGDYLIGNYFGTKDVVRIPTEKGEYRSLRQATDAAINSYREMTGDTTTRFIVKDEKDIRKQTIRLRKRVLNR